MNFEGLTYNLLLHENKKSLHSYPFLFSLFY